MVAPSSTLVGDKVSRDRPFSGFGISGAAEVSFVVLVMPISIPSLFVSV